MSVNWVSSLTVHRPRHPLNLDAGYVQGMSDLCAPVYVVMDGDEEMTFWCFVGIMERMVRRFTVRAGFCGV